MTYYQKRRMECMERAITRMEKIADDKRMRKDQKIQAFQQTLKDVKAELWALMSAEAREEDADPRPVRNNSRGGRRNVR